METLLFLNRCYGLDFMLDRKLKAENIEFEYISKFDEDDPKALMRNLKLYQKYEIRSTPVLIVLDKEEVADRLTSVEEIVEYYKKCIKS